MPMLDENDVGWASFAYLWPNWVRVEAKNINNGTGTQEQKEVTRKANLHSVLAIATQKNAQAREIIESRQTTGDDGVEPVLDGEADFAALKAHFEPKLQICIGLALKGLDTCFESLFVNWENEFDAKLTSTLAALRKCTYLQCKPSERQLITKFLAHMPDSGPWGQRKVLWTESTMNADGTFTDVTLIDLINKARFAYLQLKDSPETKMGVTAYTAMAKSNCEICGNKHTGECWYRNAQAYQAYQQRFGGAVKGGKRHGKHGPECYNCGKRGHIARNCPKKRQNNDSDNESEFDEAALRKALKLVQKKKQKAGFANIYTTCC